MRSRRVALVLLLGGCAHASGPTTRPGTISTRVVQVDSATMDSIRRAHPPTPAMEAFRRRSDSLAALVDTIVVLYPDSIVLHLGQSSQVLDSLRLEGRRGTGEAVPGAGMDVRVEDLRVALPRQEGLTALQVGRTRIVVRLIGNRAARPHAPTSYIPLVVVP